MSADLPVSADLSAGGDGLTDSELAELISRRLTAILRVVQLESDGRPVEVDGFRFRAEGAR